MSPYSIVSMTLFSLSLLLFGTLSSLWYIGSFYSLSVSLLVVLWYRLLMACVLFLIIFRASVHQELSFFLVLGSVGLCVHVSLHVLCITSSSITVNCWMSVCPFNSLFSSLSTSSFLPSLSSIWKVFEMVWCRFSKNSVCCCSFITYRSPGVLFLFRLFNSMLNFIILWSETLFSSDISQFLISARIWLLVIVISMLLFPLLFWKVVLELSSLMICS
jgi:hypothetical protein